jgi:hypothetical protein
MFTLLSLLIPMDKKTRSIITTAGVVGDIIMVSLFINKQMN